MSTRCSVYCQDVPDAANGIHAFTNMDDWFYIVRERGPYDYTAGLAMSYGDAIELAMAILEHFLSHVTKEPEHAPVGVDLPNIGPTIPRTVSMRGK